MTIRRHILGSAMQQGENGYEYLERCSIEVSGADYAEVAYNALNDPTMPQRFDTLTFDVPPNDFNLTARERRVTNVRNKEGMALALVIVEIAWRNTTTQITAGNPDDNGDGVTTIGSVTESVETEFDRLGAEITVKRNVESGDIIQPVAFRKAFPVIEFSRLEENSPRSRAQTHVGTINSTTWNGYAVGTVLCTAIVGTTRDSGQSYDVRYEFEYRSQGWDATVVFIDEDTGRPPAGLVEGVSKKSDIELYDSSNFGALNISL